jgi:hypothetical protein
MKNVVLREIANMLNPKAALPLLLSGRSAPALSTPAPVYGILSYNAKARR